MIFLNDKPWLTDAFEILELGLTTCFINDKSFRRLTIIILDNAIEIAMWNYLKYEKDILPPRNNFPELLKKVKENSSHKANKVPFFNKIKYYHEQRNPLYHQGATITDIPKEELVKQCSFTLELFEFLFEEEFEEFLLENKKVNFIKELTRLERNIFEKKCKSDEIKDYEKVKAFIESNCPYENLPFNIASDDDFENITDTIREINNSL